MRARWLLVVAVVGCQSKAPPAARATGSATVAVAAPADAQPIDAAAPKLAISCGPAMLAPRIPAPPKKRAADDVDWDSAIKALEGQGGLGIQPGDNISHASGAENTGGIGNGGVSVSSGFGGGKGNGLMAQGGGASVGNGRSNAGSQASEVKFDGWQVQGSLDKLLIQRVLQRSRPRFTWCFEKELQKAPKDNPRATVSQLVIGTNGNVMQVSVTGDAADCISDSIKTMEFPAVTGGGIAVAKVQIQYSIAVDTGRHFRDNDYYPRTNGTQAAPKPVEKPPPIPDTRSWTPYAASLGLASDDTAQAAGDELVKLMPLAKLENCFAGKNAAERAMVTVAFDGAVIGARTGGSGDAQIDSCIAVSLIGLKVTAPPTVSEVACDIVRGDPQPWRVAPEAYTVIEVGDKEIKEGGVVLTKDKLVPAKADATHAFLIVVDPAAPPAQLLRAFKRTAWAGATLVALKSDSGSPIFIAMGLDGRMREKDYAPMLGIQHVKDDVKSCVDKDSRGTSPKAEVETLLQTLANSCDPKPCPATLSIALGGTMQDLAADADAARRAKLTRIGLSTTGCP